MRNLSFCLKPLLASLVLAGTTTAFAQAFIAPAASVPMVQPKPMSSQDRMKRLESALVALWATTTAGNTYNIGDDTFTRGPDGMFVSPKEPGGTYIFGPTVDAQTLQNRAPYFVSMLLSHYMAKELLVMQQIQGMLLDFLNSSNPGDSRAVGEGMLRHNSDGTLTYTGPEGVFIINPYSTDLSAMARALPRVGAALSSSIGYLNERGDSMQPANAEGNYHIDPTNGNIYDQNGNHVGVKPGYDGGSNSGSSNPGGSNSGSSNPGGSNAGSSNPGGSNAGSSNPGGSNSGSSNPGGSNSGSSNPGGSNAGSSNPGGSNAGSSNPGGSNSGSSNPGGSNAGSSNPGGSNSGSSNTGGLNPGVSNPGSSNPGGSNPGSSNSVGNAILSSNPGASPTVSNSGGCYMVRNRVTGVTRCE